jgi:hypothetical protein
MKPILFIRSAAVITLLLGVGHMLGRPWTPANDPLALVVVGAMKSHSMHVMGFDRTFMDFYQGFGLMLGVTLFVQAAVLWIAAGLMSSDPARGRAIAAVFLLANAAQTVIAGIYLFTAPLVLSLLVTLCLGVAVVKVRETPAARVGAV